MFKYVLVEEIVLFDDGDWFIERATFGDGHKRYWLDRRGDDSGAESFKTLKDAWEHMTIYKRY